ncbi:MAG: SigE family RNA polymerase sigma factor [Mycobacteriales bacterium]
MESFDAYVSGRGSALLRTAYLLTGDRYLAEDLVQEVLVKAHRHWARVIRLDYPDAYLRKAMLRQYLSWRRLRRSAEITVEAIPDRPTADDDHPERHADRDVLWSLLADLPRQQRAVLVLRYYEDLPDAEIGRLLGCATATVRAHAARGLARLRETTTQSQTHGGV